MDLGGDGMSTELKRCIKRAGELGVSYGVYMAYYYATDTKMRERSVDYEASEKKRQKRKKRS